MQENLKIWKVLSVKIGLPLIRYSSKLDFQSNISSLFILNSYLVIHCSSWQHLILKVIVHLSLFGCNKELTTSPILCAGLVMSCGETETYYSLSLTLQQIPAWDRLNSLSFKPCVTYFQKYLLWNLKIWKWRKFSLHV